ncbi:PH domain-containing protein [Halomicrobium zhouii]|uniref:PH domain-containing protein n=1 Tax=Halomicrobium zhouii TaxID=767519 RepID=A0A1I6KS61_9EURY|nr:PH domain-containing protein [Halomicrobium zhouii]SFR94041.1 PH domain-containing protein [Halomicrobium zhouii]
MARGLPAVWSGLLALPFVVTGTYVAAFQAQYPIADGQATAPPAAGVVLAVFGLFVFGLGVYVQYVTAPSSPTLRQGERVVDECVPALRHALSKAFASFPVLGVGTYLLYFTELQYIYPILALAAGLYLFSTSCHRYWQNTLTKYYVTNQRVLVEYRFISLVRNEVPHDKVRGVEERRTFWESMLGIGYVIVRSGHGSGLAVTIGGIYDSDEFANTIRMQLGSHDHAEDEEADLVPGPEA